MKHNPPVREGRLQRTAGVDGTRITEFRQVLRRHGLLILIAACASLALPRSLAAFEWAMRPFFADPMPYLVGGSGLFASLLILSKFSAKPFDLTQVWWLLYLLGISIGEEWVFRLALPSLLHAHMERTTAVVVSSLIFGAIHYFTLRWRILWAIGACLAGIGLSQLMEHGDLLLVVAVHWLATFLNTRHPPQGTSRAE